MLYAFLRINAGRKGDESRDVDAEGFSEHRCGASGRGHFATGLRQGFGYGPDE
jgi:hypothetical protein